MIRSMLALALLLPLTASAVPLEMQHQGRLMDPAGAPLTGIHSVLFELYTDANTGSVVWNETQNIGFTEGYFSVTLGSTPLGIMSIEDFDQDELWLAVTVGTGAQLPTRQKLSSAPFAVRAGSVTGPVYATEIRVNGTTIVDSNGDVVADIPWSNVVDSAGQPVIDSDVIGALSCSADEAAVFDGTDWACTSVFPTALLPVGIEATDVAAGDASYLKADTYSKTEVDDAINAIDIAKLQCSANQVPLFTGSVWSCEGPLPVAALPIGTTSDHVAAGDASYLKAETYTQTEIDTAQAAIYDGTLEALNCPSGRIPWNSANGWICTNSIPAWFVPTGTTSSHVARGDTSYAKADTYTQDEVDALLALATPHEYEYGPLIPNGRFQTGDGTGWNEIDGSGTVATVSDGQAGDYVWRNSTNDVSWVNSTERITIRPDQDYRVTGAFRRTETSGARGTHFLGVILYNAAGANIAGDGTWWYFPINNVALTDTDWHYSSFNFGPNRGRAFPSGAVTMTVGAVLNYTDGNDGNRRYETTNLQIRTIDPSN